MNRIKRIACAAMCALLLMGLLCACGEQMDAAVFTEQAMAARMTGKSGEEYQKLAGLNADEVKKAFEQTLLDEADVFASYFDIDLKQCSDGIRTRIVEMYRTLLAKGKYETGVFTRSGDSYLVSLTITPMDIVKQVREQDWQQFQRDWVADYDILYEMEQAELEEEWATRILALFDGRMDSIGYLEPETISIQIVRQDGGYRISETDIERIDTLIVKY